MYVSIFRIFVGTLLQKFNKRILERDQLYINYKKIRLKEHAVGNPRLVIATPPSASHPEQAGC